MEHLHVSFEKCLFTLSLLTVFALQFICVKILSILILPFVRYLFGSVFLEDRGTSQNGLVQMVLDAPTVSICTLGRLRYLQFSVHGDGQFSSPNLFL